MKFARLGAGALPAPLMNAWSTFLSSESNGCHCRFWSFAGDKNAWLERLRFDESTNERLARDAAACGHEMGIIAYEGSDDAPRVMGWLKLGRAEEMTKLTQRPAYRSVTVQAPPSATSAQWVIGCILVDAASRRLGLARDLVREAIAMAAAHGATTLRAFPRQLTDAQREVGVHDADLFLGVASTFAALGFIAIKPDLAYPVFELELVRADSVKRL
jgi:ribosomal protein S18 acetylase RimI-like enzyme